MRHNDYFDSPLGLMEFKASESGITQVIFCGHQTTQVVENALTKECKSQLAAYFSGQRHVFDLPLDAKGTPFQQQVWHLIAQIPYGDTWTYGDIANGLNKPNAVRAVGGATGRNPLSIIVPCHRVMGASQKITGYAGGVARKHWLLKHEGCVGINLPELAPSLSETLPLRQDKTQYLEA